MTSDDNDFEKPNNLITPDSDITPSDQEQTPEPIKQQGFDFDRMDKDVEEFRKTINSINHEIGNEPNDEFNDFQTDYTPIRRRRRNTRANETTQNKEIGERLASILERSTPNLDFFLLSVLGGLIIGIGYAIDSNAILMFGIFMSPFLGPWVGAYLSGAIGDLRYFKQTIGGFITSIFMAMLASMIVGGVSRLFTTNNAIHAYYHSHLWWPDILLLVVGTVILILRFMQSEVRPIIPSLMVGYAFYLPVCVAGFGLGSGLPGLWPAGLYVFLVHLSISLIISAVMFLYLGVKPNTAPGYSIIGGLVFVSVVILGFFGGFGGNIRGDNPIATVEVTLTPTSTIVSPVKVLPTIDISTDTPPPSPTTLLATVTVPVTSTELSLEATQTPSSSFGKVQVDQGNGAILRVAPGGASITTIMNGYLAQILDDQPVTDKEGVWVHVIVYDQTKKLDGWMLKQYIITATPSYTP